MLSYGYFAFRQGTPKRPVSFAAKMHFRFFNVALKSDGLMHDQSFIEIKTRLVYKDKIGFVYKDKEA